MAPYKSDQEQSQNAAPDRPAHSLRREALLAVYATFGSKSRGRFVAEPNCAMRSPFQRDRDRIVHATAFRRLTHKTQVFLYHEGDHYRTRLTHTLEVAQIARALARLLRVDEDLAEALALAHDLGHPPFGHAGERALAQAMQDYGGFDHNAQSLKVVTALEHKYAGFDGLNLTWETLEGLVKHNGPLLGAHVGHKNSHGAGCQAKALPQAISKFNQRFDLALDRYASIEAQIAAIADDIAYNNHDIDDGLRAGLITLDELRDMPLAGRFVQQISQAHRELGGHKVIYEVNRRMITAMVEDVAAEARQRLAEVKPGSSVDVGLADRPMVAFSAGIAAELAELRQFLFAHVYRHAKVMHVMTNAEQIVCQLFAHYMETPASLPSNWREVLAAAIGPAGEGAPGAQSAKAQIICDFVAGMTDRYAIQEHRRLFDVTPDLR